MSQADGTALVEAGRRHRSRESYMEDPAPEHLWFDAIGSIAIIAALAVVFIVGILKAEKVPAGRSDDFTPLAMSAK